MLTSSQLDALPQPILDLYAEFEQLVINDIARRLVKLDFTEATQPAAWQMQRLTESGEVYDNALKELSGVTGRSEDELRALFDKAGVTAMSFDDDIYIKAGLKPMPLNLSPAMTNVLKVGIKTTGGTMRNLTASTALDAQQKFIHAADLVYMNVSHGTMSYQQAIRQAIKAVAAQGVETINYANGHRDRLDVAMRRTVITGVNRTTGMLQEARADELGVDLVAVSAHPGARNKGTGPKNHASWQGRIYSRSGKHSQYPDFVATTGYGTGEGLLGWNCRHSFYSFFPGISENAYKARELREYETKSVTFNGVKISLYDATQIQRGIERKIRYWKRQADALDAARVDSSPETGKVLEYQAMMRSFLKQVNLMRQYDREQA